MSEEEVTTTQSQLPSEPTASIVICVYNRAHDVVDCLDSVLQLCEKDREIVLVDDCSTDTTADVLTKYASDHPHAAIKIVRNPQNLGVSGARNTGIDAASGKFVFFTDSDCTVDPNWLTEHLEALSDTSISAVAGRVIEDPPCNLAERAKYGGSRIAKHRWQGRRLIGCNMGFRHDILKNYRFDENLSYYCDEDDIALRMADDNHEFAFVSDAVVYHHHPFTIGSYIRQAWLQGKGSAHFWWKHGIYLGRDVILMVVASVLLLSAMFWHPLLLAVAFVLLVQLAALLFNEVRLKEKTPFEALIVLPIILIANLVKTLSVVRFQVAYILIKPSRKSVVLSDDSESGITETGEFV